MTSIKCHTCGQVIPEEMLDRLKFLFKEGARLGTLVTRLYSQLVQMAQDHPGRIAVEKELSTAELEWNLVREALNKALDIKLRDKDGA